MIVASLIGAAMVGTAAYLLGRAHGEARAAKDAEPTERRTAVNSRSAGARRPKEGGPDTAGTLSPVRCTYCNRTYDLGAVEVTARYEDCSVWVTPCCGRTVDDRPGWGGRTKAFARLEARRGGR